ncbi:MAG: threonine-phosphate decarboxylase CobD [Bacillota bacterium]|nr:threonine-phosphate decarboxylase CobD [Bacillota bacterium]
MQKEFNDETGGHGGDLSRALSRWNPGVDLLDFSSNINPCGPPSGLLTHLHRELDRITAYPVPQARELRKVLAGYLGVPVSRLLLGNGATELIHLLTLWRKPQKVLVPAPSFSEYRRAACLAGAEVEEYPLPPGEEFVSLPPVINIERGDLVVFCNPNNPTGQLYSRRTLLSLADTVKDRRSELLLDESFIPLSGREEESLRHREGGGLWIVLSLTKLWSLPGLRLGCLIGPEENIGELTRWGDPWRVNSLAQAAGLYCLKQESFLKKSLEIIGKERSFMKQNLRESGHFKVFEGAANYLLLQGLDFSFDAADLQAYLAKRGLLIRRADNFSGLDKTYFRIAVLRRHDNLRLLRGIDNWFEEGCPGSGQEDWEGEEC